MLQKQTIEPGTLDLLKRLMQDERLADFVLVGGTALSLQLGHRRSIDLDLFTQDTFDAESLVEYLEASLDFKVDFISANTIKGESGGIKVDFIRHHYPSIANVQELEHIRLASIDDILAMKLNAIVVNGTRLKDFVDVAFSSTVRSLNQMIEAYELKYATRNPLMAIKALAYQTDLNFNEPIQIIGKKFDWTAVRSRLSEMIVNPSRVFPDY